VSLFSQQGRYPEGETIMKPSQIFISYSSKDYQYACKLYDDLLSARYWVWIDKKNLEPAKEWEPQIDENLKKSKILVALISSKSVVSDWVKHEGSIAFALNQVIIPVKIEPFGIYSASDLPIWAAKIQLLDLIDGSPEYDDQFQRLKQVLGEPLPIRQHLKEMLIHYQNSGMLLDEVALDLIERHYGELYLTKEEQEIADKLIEESRRKLDDYWVRYDKLEKDYENAKTTISILSNRFKDKVDSLNKEIESLNKNIASGDRLQLALFASVYLALACYILSLIIYFVSR